MRHQQPYADELVELLRRATTPMTATLSALFLKEEGLFV